MTKTPAQLDAEIETAQKTCNTCGRPVESPFRRHDAHGKVVEGCVDDSHTGHLYGESYRWHMRPAAREIRREAKTRLRELLKSGRR